MSLLPLKRAISLWAFDNFKKGLEEPMVWITGPRQVGKTYFSLHLTDKATYYNWDTPETRRAYAKDPYFFRSESPLVIFDEIHKRKDWKKILKGYYDSPTRKENFLVTGSGHMDQYRKSGDSLQGRYDLFHLLPLTFDEVIGIKQNTVPAKPRNWEQWSPQEASADDLNLLELGGFPKPYLQGSIQRLKRWQDQYLDRLIREDARDFSDVKRIDQLDLLARILPERVASPLSYLSLGEDIESSHVAVKSWIRLFELIYLGFLVKPFHRKIHRAVKKEPKWYFYQWTFIENRPARFENYVAVQLLAACHAWSEQGYGRFELYYLRDQNKREVDFVICNNLKPLALIEAKSQFENWDASLYYYTQKLQIPGFLIYPGKSQDRVKRIEDKGWVLPSCRFLPGLLLKS